MNPESNATPTSTIIDSHVHLSWQSFQEDQKEVINRAFDRNVCQMVNAGVDFKTIPEIIALAESFEHIYAGVGLHPHEARDWDSDSRELLSRAAANPKVVAIGECGLDFYYNHSDRDTQLHAFAEQVKLAAALNKPLIIHSRDAWDETFAVLEKEGKGQVRGVFHCFTGGLEHLPAIESLDFYVSFSGIVTFKKAQSIQKAAPLVKSTRIMVETDCPYLAPHPHRGKRNEPAFVWHTAEKLAELRNEDIAEIAGQTSSNARTLFDLPVI